MKKGMSMQNALCLILILLAGIFSIVGSAPRAPQYKWQNTPATKANDFFEATATPVCQPQGCTGFRLDIKNLTDSEMEIIWDKTVFISGQTTTGGFYWDGIAFHNRNLPKPPDYIFPKGNFFRVIFPVNYVSSPSDPNLRRQGIWFVRHLAPGENGVYLTIKIKDNEVREKIITTIKGEKIEN